jgi:hypothetical protein
VFGVVAHSSDLRQGDPEIGEPLDTQQSDEVGDAVLPDDPPADAHCAA